MREARRALLSVACAMTRASACGSSWLSVESRRVALATIATPSRADAPRRRPVAAVRHATAAEATATHWAGRQKARAALASATRLMSESDRASFAAFDVRTFSLLGEKREGHRVEGSGGQRRQRCRACTGASILSPMGCASRRARSSRRAGSLRDAQSEMRVSANQALGLDGRGVAAAQWIA